MKSAYIRKGKVLYFYVKRHTQIIYVIQFNNKKLGSNQKREFIIPFQIQRKIKKIKNNKNK